MSAEIAGFQSCVVCSRQLNKHARRIDNNGSLNLFSCFGIDSKDPQVWLCSSCRRNFGRHKATGGAKRYAPSGKTKEARQARRVKARQTARDEEDGVMM